MQTGGTGNVFRGMMDKMSGMTSKLSMPRLNMPSRSDISSKLGSIKTSYEGSRLESSLDKAGRGAKKGGGQLLIGASSLVGSDKGVTKGESMKGRKREYTPGEAKLRKGDAGRSIKKKWGKVVAGFGKMVESAGDAIFKKSKSNSRLEKMGLDISGWGGGKKVDGEIMTELAGEKGKRISKENFVKQRTDVKMDRMEDKCKSKPAEAGLTSARNNYRMIQNLQEPAQSDLRAKFNAELNRIYASDDVEKEFIASSSKGELSKIGEEASVQQVLDKRNPLDTGSS